MMRILGFLAGLFAVGLPAAGWLVASGRVSVPDGWQLARLADAPAVVAQHPDPPEPEPAFEPEPPQSSQPPKEKPAEAPATAMPEPPIEPPAAPDASESPDPTLSPPDPRTGAPESLVEDAGAEAPVQRELWKPFRSERAARGFAAHLAEHYGVAGDVRRDGPGVYRVIVTAPSAEALDMQLDRLRAEAGLVITGDGT